MDPRSYLDLFVAEAREHLGAAQELATGLSERTDAEQALRELFRHLHSLKGMAGSMGYSAMSALAHDAESWMDRWRGAGAPAGGGRGILAAALGCLERMVDAAQSRAAVIDDAERPTLQARLRGPMEASDPGFDPGGHASPQRTGAAAAAGCVRVALIVRRDAAFPAVRAAMVLGRVARLGRIVGTEPPMAALRMGRFDGRLMVTLVSDLSVRALGAKLSAVEDVATFTLSPAQAPVEPPPARDARLSLKMRADRLDALLQDALDVMTSLGRIHARAATAKADASSLEALEAAARTARRVYDGLVDTRLVPFEIAARRLTRSVEDLARRLGKPVRLEVEGRDVRIDRGILEGLADPLLQLVRNAIDHGIEPEDERRRRKKPVEGRIGVAVERRSARLVVTVRDDGRGLDARAIKQEAVERGLVAPAQAVKLTEPEALQLITLPGFSTSRSPNEISGRGVGMDIVRSGVEALGGRLKIDTTPGRGTRFEMTFPIGVCLVGAYLVRSGGETFAVPLSALERIAVLDDQNTEWRDGSRFLSEGEIGIPLLRLGERLGLDDEGDRDAATVLVCPTPLGPRGLEVDAVLERSEIVVRPLPAPLDALDLYAGAACLPDGSIALLLDLPAVLGVGRR